MGSSAQRGRAVPEPAAGSGCARVPSGAGLGVRGGFPAALGCLPTAGMADAMLTPPLLPTAAFLTQSVCLDDTTVKFEIWDTAGQERYHSLAPMYYRGAQAAIVVYDITNQVGSPSGLLGCQARGTLVELPGSEGLRGSGGARGRGGLPRGPSPRGEAGGGSL